MFDDLKERIVHAAVKHPDPQNVALRYDALRREVDELYAEIDNDNADGIYHESLDVATVAMRIAGQALGLDALGILKREQGLLVTVFENLRTTQARCTEQQEEIRALRAALLEEKVYREGLARNLKAIVSKGWIVIPENGAQE